jgi:hypothetical protein
VPPAKASNQAPASSDDSTVTTTVPVPDNAAIVRAAQLANSVKAYRAQPDPASWEIVLKDVSALLSVTAKVPAASLLKENACLSDLGARVHDAGGARIWTFSKVAESQTAIVQWQNFAPGPEEVIRVRGKKRVVRGAPVVSWKMQALHLPGGVVVQEAKLVSPAVAISGVGKKAVRTEYPRTLILAGTEKTGNTWLHGYRLAEGAWVESADLFSGVPPYLLQNLAGKVSFSGNDLVVAVGTQGTAATSSNGYRIVLRLLGGKYCLEGKSGGEGPISVVEQFALALQQNRLDLAKGWLSDAKLMSIPKYVGITGHSSGQPLRIIPMASPGNGNSRFRLMTFSKDDLIVDVGRDKKTQQLAIKAIFIAPPDPLAQKLLGSLAVPATADVKPPVENVGK